MPTRIWCGPQHSRSLDFSCVRVRTQTRTIDNEGDTPLHHTCYGGMLEAAEILLHYNANPSVKSEFLPTESLTLLNWHPTLQITGVRPLFNVRNRRLLQEDQTL
ncbi:hypothetical protein FA13DRAFT_776798 [Coprinellus micaceus]|uniref:Uncharacterized protein n=1 Tax=Coprinellus micaceus TaxID=71717 RepID=A0A4Y7T3F7_COPMI|nr:hypothetical protein FA13DRAFT_776798 [Coprinellus micaceus]